MSSKERTLEAKLNFINDAKKTNIARIHVEAINFGRMKALRYVPKKRYKFGVH